MLENEGASTEHSQNNEKVEQKWTFKPLKKSLHGNFEKHFANYDLHETVKSEPEGFVVTQEFARHVEKVYRFQPRVNDVWVITFPKCGTTWTQELVWMVLNDCNVEKARQPLLLRSPFLEMPYIVSPKTAPPELVKIMLPLEAVDQMPSPRVIKSHLPFNFLNPNLLDTCKVVYVARNPKDVIVSFYYHHKLMKMQEFSGDIGEFAQYFMDDELIFCPYFPHILDGWSKRHHPNMLFLFYEDLKRDLLGELKKVAAFLNKTLSEEQFLLLREHLRFDNFKKNEAVNFEIGKSIGATNTEGHFIRKGKTGDWKNHFSPELNNRIDEWIQKNLIGSDLKFVTELESQD